MKDIIKVVGFVDIPYVYSCFTLFPQHCRDPGIDIMLLYYQLIVMGFQVEFVEAKNITDAYRYLINGEADISGFSYNLINPQVEAYLDATMPMYEDQIVIFRKQMQEYNPPNLLFNLCPYSVWLFVLGTLICTLTYKFGHKVLKHKVGPYNPGDKQFSHKFPLLAWSFCFGIFLSIYSQYLGITLSIQMNRDQPFNNFKSVIKKLINGQCKLFVREVEKDELISYVPRSLQNQTQTIPVQYIKDDESLVKVIQQSDCNLCITLETTYMHLNAKFGGIRLVELHDMPVITYVYYYRKKHPLKNRLAIINSGSAHSKYKSYLNIAMNQMRFCNKDKHTQPNFADKPLSLIQLGSVFWLLVIGSLFSIATFVVSNLADRFLPMEKLKSFHDQWSRLQS